MKNELLILTLITTFASGLILINATDEIYKTQGMITDTSIDTKIDKVSKALERADDKIITECYYSENYGDHYVSCKHKSGEGFHTYIKDPSCSNLLSLFMGQPRDKDLANQFVEMQQTTVEEPELKKKEDSLAASGSFPKGTEFRLQVTPKLAVNIEPGVVSFSAGELKALVELQHWEKIINFVDETREKYYPSFEEKNKPAICE